MDSSIECIRKKTTITIDVSFRHSSHLKRMTILFQKSLGTGNDHARKTYHEIGLPLGRQHQCNTSALAVTKYAYMIKPFTQEPDSCQGIILQILCGARYYITRRLSETTVVISQCGDSCFCKCVGDYRKRLVLEYLLVPVLESASGNHDQHRRLATTILRSGQCSFQNSIAIRERDISIDINKRADRRLGALQSWDAWVQWHRKRHAVLGECAGNKFACPNTFI